MCGRGWRSRQARRTMYEVFPENLKRPPWVATFTEHTFQNVCVRNACACVREPTMSAERGSQTISASASHCVQLTAITWTGMNRTYVTFPVTAMAGIKQTSLWWVGSSRKQKFTAFSQTHKNVFTLKYCSVLNFLLCMLLKCQFMHRSVVVKMFFSSQICFFFSFLLLLLSYTVTYTDK